MAGKAKQFKVGQKLWYVTTQRYDKSRWIVISKIGRKWITCKEYRNEIRIDLVTMWADGGKYPSPGKCHLSQEEYQQEQDLLKAHDTLYRSLSHRPHTGVTIEDVQAAAELLRIELSLSGIKQ